MKNKIKIKTTTFIFMLSLVYCQSFAQYSVTKYTINNGGENMAGGSYEMDSSIGEIDASNKMNGGSYSMNGGFWHQQESIPLPELMFSDGFEN